MLISLQSDLKKRIRLSLIIDLANDSIGSSECRDSTITHHDVTMEKVATSDLLNSENLKVAFSQLCKELHVCNFTML